MTLYYLFVHALRTSFVSDRNVRLDRTLDYMTRWSKSIVQTLGVKVRTSGDTPVEGKLVAPNHQSYLDVIVLSSITPLTFVSKAEVATWPFIGFLLRRADQLFVSRSRSKDLLITSEGIVDRLKGGRSVCVFLEGTTSGGDKLLRFFSPLLEPAIVAGAHAVPTAIRYEIALPGCSVSEDVAYWKDHTFLSHLWRLIGLSEISVVVRFGTPVSSQEADRRQLATELHSQVRAMLTA